MNGSLGKGHRGANHGSLGVGGKNWLSRMGFSWTVGETFQGDAYGRDAGDYTQG